MTSDNLDITPRTFVSAMSMKIDHDLNAIITKLLLITPEKTRSFGASSEALSFNAKANLLFDLNKLDATSKAKFQMFIDIKNTFADVPDLDTFENCFDLTKSYSELRKIYRPKTANLPLEEQMKSIFSQLATDVTKIIAYTKEELYEEMAVKHAQKRFMETVKERRETYKLENPDNANAVEHFLNYIKRELLNDLDHHREYQTSVQN